jgi:hypothetical protein
LAKNLDSVEKSAKNLDPDSSEKLAKNLDLVEKSAKNLDSSEKSSFRLRRLTHICCHVFHDEIKRVSKTPVTRVRIFAYGSMVYFGQRFENYRSSAKLWATFFRGNSDVLSLSATFWATFFTNSSGHRACDPFVSLRK